jgi:CheY-like chemotaxis protein
MTPKILVVDDETYVREMVCSMLTKAGYNVSHASDGLVAYERVKECSGSVNLVVTDIRMPRMDGCELVRRLTAEYPDIKILCMSGYADPMSPNGHYFLAKPFTFGALRAIVQDVLALHPPNGHAGQPPAR